MEYPLETKMITQQITRRMLSEERILLGRCQMVKVELRKKTVGAGGFYS